MQLTFLQIAQAAFRDAGFVGSFTTVLNPTGRVIDIVRWVQEAFEAIQLRRPDWRHDWQRATFDLSAGKETYDPASDWGIAGGIRSFERDGSYVYRPLLGLSSRAWLGFYDWPIARDLNPPVVPGYPVAFSLMPDNKVFFYPQPAEALKLVTEFRLWPQALTLDADIPRIPSAFHLAIVHRTVMLAADFNKDWSRYDSAEQKYEAMIDKMAQTQTPTWTQGGPLA